MARVTLAEVKEKLEGIIRLIECYPEQEADLEDEAMVQINRLPVEEACEASRYWHKLTS